MDAQNQNPSPAPDQTQPTSAPIAPAPPVTTLQPQVAPTEPGVGNASEVSAPAPLSVPEAPLVPSSVATPAVETSSVDNTSQTPPTTSQSPEPQPAEATTDVASHPQTRGKHKNLKRIELGLAIITIIGAASGFYFTNLTPTARANNLANGFMSNVANNNVPGAAKVTYAKDSNEAKQNLIYLQNVASGVAGDYKLVGSNLQSTKGYYLYSLSNPSNKYARLTIAKINGKWWVESLDPKKTKVDVTPSNHETMLMINSKM